MKMKRQDRNYGLRKQRHSPDATAEHFTSRGVDPEGFSVLKIHNEIGLGVFANKDFKKNDFLMEYQGEFITPKEADSRSEQYTERKCGSFIFYDVKNIYGKNVCIDATNLTCLGRMVNDSPEFTANSKMKRMIFNRKVHLCLFAKKDIESGTEIRYDYLANIEDMPWRKHEWLCIPLSLEDIKEITQADKENTIPYYAKKSTITHLHVCYENIHVKNDTVEQVEDSDCEGIPEILSGLSLFNSLNGDIDFKVTDVQTRVECGEVTLTNYINLKDTIKMESDSSLVQDVQTREECGEVTLTNYTKLKDTIKMDTCSDSSLVQDVQTRKECGEVTLTNYTKLKDTGTIEMDSDSSIIQDVQTKQEDGDPTLSKYSEWKEDINIEINSTVVPVSQPREEDRKHNLKECNIEKETDHFSDTSLSVANVEEESFYSPLNDSGLELESIVDVVDTDSEHKDEVAKYKKPGRPCIFCGSNQSRLKRHILTKHKNEEQVLPLFNMTNKEQDFYIDKFRREAIRKHNINVLKSGENQFLRQRSDQNVSETDIPVMCSGCKGFFAKSYKARHQLVCPVNGSNLMFPVVAINNFDHVDSFSDEYKDLLNSLHQDDVGTICKTDPIILMIGNRSFSANRRKKDKTAETKRSTRAKMRLAARLYAAFKQNYDDQSEIKLIDACNNASDMFRRETILILALAIDTLCDNDDQNGNEKKKISITGQKTGLKVAIFNLIKLISKYLIGYYLVRNEDNKSTKVTEFLHVLKCYEDDIFSDAYYDINYRANIENRKPVNLPSDKDVEMLLNECRSIMSNISMFDLPNETFLKIRSATVTLLIIFNARRGGEPVRLTLSQWEEALSGEWLDKSDENQDKSEDHMLVTYQTGKGANHLVPIMFPPETFQAMKYLSDTRNRKMAGVLPSNHYVFASTQNSENHTSGWHCINEILSKLSLKGAINATSNRHRVASLLAKLQLSEQERELVYSHFGHTEKMNKNRYQAAAGSMQLQVTGKRLSEIHNGASTKSSPLAASSRVGSPQSNTSFDPTNETANTLESLLDNTNEENHPEGKVERESNKRKNTSEKETLLMKCSKMERSYTNSPKRKTKKVEYKKRNNTSSSAVDEEESFQPSEESSSEEEVVKKRNTQRKYARWSVKTIEKFNDLFDDYIKKQVKYPPFSMMNTFATQSGLSVSQVKTRIMNSRNFYRQGRAKLATELEI